MEKIVFFETEEWEKEHVADAFGSEAQTTEEKLSEKNIELAKGAEVISTFIYSTLNREILSQLPNLKFIATRSTGFDHIDLAFCKEKGIVVSNVPTYGVNTVAEHTFALILALSRKIIPSVEQTRKYDFSLDGLAGLELHGKTLGVIGAGNIGKRAIEIGLAFGMKILVFTRNPDDSLLKKGDIKFVSLEDLLANSDVITLHVPYNDSTHYLINRGNIGKFKKGSILINTARGGIVETQAVLDGLDQGILGGVGLDVLEEECSVKEERELLTSEFLKTCDIKTQLLNHVLVTKENVVVTPHNAFNSREALSQILTTTVSNIKSYLEGKPQNIVS
ncbi:MAG: hydroxyacid dehydrogenase [Candidatus Levybacteria bacterium]|nr:hydroxyacid dehydrogenase [Candidatus Levybacteria bacterium]